jgi:transposase-like protein
LVEAKGQLLYNFKTSPENILKAVAICATFPLSLLTVEDLLSERAIDISQETFRF